MSLDALKTQDQVSLLYLKSGNATIPKPTNCICFVLFDGSNTWKVTYIVSGTRGKYEVFGLDTHGSV